MECLALLPAPQNGPADLEDRSPVSELPWRWLRIQGAGSAGGLSW